MSKLRGKLINVVAIKDNKPYFNVGDKIQVQAVLYDKPKLLTNALCGAYTKDGELLGLRGCPSELIDAPIGTKLMMDSKYNNGQYLVKAFDAEYVPIGSYNYSVIICNGNEYNDSIMGYRSLGYAFEKI